MENVLFALGPNGSYFYNAPKASMRHNLPDALEKLFEQDLVSDVRWAAFGPTRDSYVFVYVKKSGQNVSVAWGGGIPKELSQWLVDGSGELLRDGYLKVALGPSDSFFAWDTNSIRWHNIPDGLQKAVQSWLGPAGWMKGPPRIIALGADGSYYALSEFGSWSYNIPDGSKTLSDEFKLYSKDIRYDVDTLEYVCFSASVPDHFSVVHKSTLVRCNIPGGELDAVQREKAAQSKLAAETQAKAQAQRAELESYYATWRSRCSESFQKDAPLLKQFPHLPAKACTCEIHSCKLRKSSTGLLACRHDVEELLRLDRSYSPAWLRAESLKWHPDRFAKSCSAAEKPSLLNMTTELYSIFRELIEDVDGPPSPSSSSSS